MKHASRRALAATLALCAFAVAGVAHAGTKPPTYCGAGAISCSDPPFAGAVTADAAQVWLRLNADGASARLRLRATGQKTWKQTPSQVSDAASDDTLKFALGGLGEGKTYEWQVGIVQAGGGSTWSKSQFFRTAPAAPTTLSFTVMSDFANKLVASPALRTAAAMSNDLVVFLGDMDHRNPATEPDGKSTYPPGSPEVLSDMRAMHQDMRRPNTAIGADFSAGLLASTATRPQTPFYYAWDDHDFCANNQDEACPTRDIAFQTYRENYLWAADSAMADGSFCKSDFQRISWGPLADLFVLDARSDRVSSGEGATMLGSCQLNWLVEGLRSSTATWKFILSPVPMNRTTKTYDAWGDFPAEEQQLLDALAADGVRNVIVLSGDIHSGGAYDDGTHSGLREFSVPHANMPDSWVNTFCRPVNAAKKNGYVTDEPGTWTVGSMTPANTVPVTTCLGTDYPGKPAQVSTPGPYPLDGVGSPGFARIELNGPFATVTLYGADGQVRAGVLADGTPSPLQRTFLAE